MSQTLWCDIDDPETNAPHQMGHCFPAKDMDRKHFAQTQMVPTRTGDSYGRSTYQDREEITDELDMCGYHWRKQNPFHAANTPEIPAPPTLEDLEERDNEWRAGYDAAMNKVLNR
jgi:hypothetical protein